MGSHFNAKQTLELAPAFKIALLNSSFPFLLMPMDVCLSLVFRKTRTQIIYSCLEFEVRIVVPSGIGLNREDAASKMVILITLFGDILIWMRKFCYFPGV